MSLESDLLVGMTILAILLVVAITGSVVSLRRMRHRTDSVTAPDVDNDKRPTDVLGDQCTGDNSV